MKLCVSPEARADLYFGAIYEFCTPDDANGESSARLGYDGNFYCGNETGLVPPIDEADKDKDGCDCPLYYDYAALSNFSSTALESVEIVYETVKPTVRGRLTSRSLSVASAAAKRRTIDLSGLLRLTSATMSTARPMPASSCTTKTPGRSSNERAVFLRRCKTPSSCTLSFAPAWVLLPSSFTQRTTAACKRAAPQLLQRTACSSASRRVTNNLESAGVRAGLASAMFANRVPAAAAAGALETGPLSAAARVQEACTGAVIPTCCAWSAAVR